MFDAETNKKRVLYQRMAKIKSPGIETELQVKVPTIEGLLGDKLTAFAPHTIGVPFVTKKGRPMAMQVIKQLYDLGELFDIAASFEDIKNAFNATFKKENGYHENGFTREQVLQDTIETCFALLQIRLKGFKNNEVSNHLEDGIKRISSHLLNDKFTVDKKAKVTASKLFCIANLLFSEKSFDFDNERYQNSKIEMLTEVNLPAPYEKLNRLKPIVSEAFYYIWMGTL